MKTDKKKRVTFSLYIDTELNKKLIEWAEEESQKLGISLSKNDLIVRLLSKAIEHKKFGNEGEGEKNHSKKNTDLKRNDLFSNKFERRSGNGKHIDISFAEA